MNSQYKLQTILLHKALSDIDKSLPETAILEPLFPGSLTLRQARLSTQKISDEIGEFQRQHTNTNTNTNKQISLLPDPHAWYIAHRAVPDIYLEPVKDKHLPYILVSHKCALNSTSNELAKLLSKLARSPCNLFVMQEGETEGLAFSRFQQKLKQSAPTIQGIYSAEGENGANKLSLIRHAKTVVGEGIAEIADAVALGVPSVWFLGGNKWSLDSRTSMGESERLQNAQHALQQYAVDRLKSYSLIVTLQDLATELNKPLSPASPYSEDTSSRAIMPLALPQHTLTQRQKRALAVSTVVRKFKKFRESPKRFIQDSKFYLFKVFS